MPLCIALLPGEHLAPGVAGVASVLIEVPGGNLGLAREARGLEPVGWQVGVSVGQQAGSLPPQALQVSRQGSGWGWPG